MNQAVQEDNPCIVPALLSKNGQEGGFSKIQIKQDVPDYAECRIPDGFSDIAKGLGLQPKDVAFDTNYLIGDEALGGCNKDKAGFSDYQDVAMLTCGDTAGLSLKLPGGTGFVGYLEEFLGIKSPVELTSDAPPSEDMQFPRDSVSIVAARISNTNNIIREIFQERVYVPCLTSCAIEEAVSEAGGKVLVSSEMAHAFNSKVRFYESAESDGYSVAPYVVVRSFDEMESRMRALREKAVKLGLNPDQTKYWVKFDNLLGGEGVRPYDPRTMSFSEIKGWVLDVLKSTHANRNAFHPLVMDIDIGELPETFEVTGNMNVQGIVGSQGVTLTGATFQKTENGTYLGGVMPESCQDFEMARESYACAARVLNASWRGGYRGYAGVDVIVTEDRQGHVRPYGLEVNARLNASTSMLRVSHFVSRESGVQNASAMTLSVDLKPLKDFGSFAEALNGQLYRGSETDFSGLIPLHFDVGRNRDLIGVKMIAVAPSVSRMGQVRTQWNALRRNLVP